MPKNSEGRLQVTPESDRGRQRRGGTNAHRCQPDRVRDAAGWGARQEADAKRKTLRGGPSLDELEQMFVYSEVAPPTALLAGPPVAVESI
jgi:hypothetical protein